MGGRFPISYCAFHSLEREEMELDVFLNVVVAAGIEELELGVAGVLKTRGMDAALLLTDMVARERLVRLLHGHGLGISALNCVGNPLHPDQSVATVAEQALRTTIELAAELGVRRVVSTSGCPGSGISPTWIVWPVFWDDVKDKQWSHAILTWSALGEFAERRGVIVCLELHPGMLVYNTTSFRTLRAAVGPGIAVNLDPSHLFYQGMDPIQMVRVLGPEIGFVHVKDTVMNEERVALDGVLDSTPLDAEGRSWTYRAIGTGHSIAWWSELFDALWDAGYRGPLSIEHEDPYLAQSEAIRVNAAALQSALTKRDKATPPSAAHSERRAER